MGDQYVLETREGHVELFDTLSAARGAFDEEVEMLADAAGGDGWPEEAEYRPRLYVAYLLTSHGLTNQRTIEQVGAEDPHLAETMRERGWDFFADPLVTEHSDPVAALTAERDDALARVAMLEAARSADRAMLCRILGVESDASISVLLEQVETLLGRCVERGEP